MPKRVRMVAEILSANCTGCRLCEQVCPTVAITMRDRRDDEPGPGRRIAEIEGDACYNAQTCFEICPDDAIVMQVLLDEPFDVELDRNGIDEDAVEGAVRQKAGYPHSKQTICLCTDTNGRVRSRPPSSPERKGAGGSISLMTGARTGCVELCLQPIIDLRRVRPGTATGPEESSKNGFQWYGRVGHVVREDRQTNGTFPDEAASKRMRSSSSEREIVGSRATALDVR